MLLGFKTKLNPNNKQRTLFSKHCGIARHAWNIGLTAVKEIIQHNKTNPDNKLKFPSSVDLHKWLVASIKPDCPWYYEVSNCSHNIFRYGVKSLTSTYPVKNCGKHRL